MEEKEENGGREKAEEITIALIYYNNGKYFHEDEEVYPYFHLGPRAYRLGVQSPAGELPPKYEVIKNSIIPLLRELSKRYPRLTKKTNGLVLVAERYEAKKEQVREGKDSVTVEERGEVIVIPCRYTPSSGKKRMTLEDPEMFGDIF